MKRLPLLLCLSSVLFGACDCENRVRKILSNRDTPKVRKGETLAPTKLSSAPMEKEPNDVVDQATSLVLTSELRAIGGELKQSGDVDWIALSCKCKPGETWLLDVRVEPQVDGLEPLLDFELPGQPGGLTYRVQDQTAGVLSVPVVAVSNTPLRLAIRSANGGFGKYSIRFKRRLSGGVVEAEPNDYIERAWPMKVPGELQGFFDRKGDRDILALDVKGLDRNRLYTLQVTAPKGGQMMVGSYFDDTLKDDWLPVMVLEPSQVGEVPNIRVPKSASVLFLSLTAGAYASSKDAYRVRLVPHPTTADKVVMEWEPDEAFGQTQIISTTTTIQGYFHVGDASDTMSVVLPEKKKSPAVIDDIKPGGDSASGAEVVLPGKANEKSTPDAAPDEDALPRPEPLVLSPWPKKAMPDYLVDVLIKTTSPKLFVSGTFGEGSTLLSSKAPAQNNRVICRQPLKAGAYPLVLTPHPQEGLSSSLKDRGYVTLVRVIEPTQGIEIEPNQSRETADVIKPGQSIEGVIATAGDVDYYVLDLPEAAKTANAFGQYLHKVKISLDKHPANLKLMIYDTAGVAMGSVNKAGQGGVEVYKGQWQQGRYWIAVSSERGNICKPYTLRVNVQ